MDFLIPCPRVHLASRSTNEERPLSQTEKKVRKVLSKTNRQTGIGFGIHLALSKKTSSALRGIISELKDQLRDAPIELKNVIGEEGIQLLKKL